MKKKIENVTKVELTVGGYNIYHFIEDEDIGTMEEDFFLPFGDEYKYDVGISLECGTCEHKNDCTECSKGIAINRDHIEKVKKEHVFEITKLTTLAMDAVTLLVVGEPRVSLEKAKSLREYYSDKYARAKNDMIKDKREQAIIIKKFEYALNVGGEIQDIIRDIEKLMISNIGRVEITHSIIEDYMGLDISDITEQKLSDILADIKSRYE